MQELNPIEVLDHRVDFWLDAEAVSHALPVQRHPVANDDIFLTHVTPPGQEELPLTDEIIFQPLDNRRGQIADAPPPDLGTVYLAGPSLDQLSLFIDDAHVDALRQFFLTELARGNETFGRPVLYADIDNPNSPDWQLMMIRKQIIDGKAKHVLVPFAFYKDDLTIKKLVEVVGNEHKIFPAMVEMVDLRPKTKTGDTVGKIGDELKRLAEFGVAVVDNRMGSGAARDNSVLRLLLEKKQFERQSQPPLKFKAQ